MLEWWMDLPAWLRVTMGLVTMAAGGLVLWAGMSGALMPGRRVVFYGAFGLIGAGLAMVVIGEKSSSEKNGYRF